MVLLVALSLGPATGPAVGQTPKASSEERQKILSYQLTMPRANHLIAAMDARTKYVVSRPDFQARLAKAMGMTPAERRAEMEKDPNATAILKQNGLTAEEYLVGVPALRMALMVVQERRAIPRSSPPLPMLPSPKRIWPSSSRRWTRRTASPARSSGRSYAPPLEQAAERHLPAWRRGGRDHRLEDPSNRSAPWRPCVICSPSRAMN